MNKGAKIYLAGHTGLVGSALMRRLQAGGYTNLIYRDISEMDLRCQAETEAFFEREKPEYVFLAAAKVGGIMANNTYKAEFIYDNLMIAANVINASYKFKVKKLLNLGSSCIYPKLAPQPLKEEYLLTGALEATNEPYAVAKIAAIKLCRYYNEQYGTNFISVMPTNQYGLFDNFNLETAHVLPAMIRKVHLAKLLMEDDLEAIRKDLNKYPVGFGMDKKGEIKAEKEIVDLLAKVGVVKGKLTLWGSGEPYREFLFSDDLASACVYLMENKDAKEIGELVNIGSGEDLKIKELALIIKEIVGFEGEIDWDKTKPDGTPRKLLDVSRIKDLGWRPKVGFDEGIQKTYSWYKEKMK